MDSNWAQFFKNQLTQKIQDIHKPTPTNTMNRYLYQNVETLQKCHKIFLFFKLEILV